MIIVDEIVRKKLQWANTIRQTVYIDKSAKWQARFNLEDYLNVAHYYYMFKITLDIGDHFGKDYPET